MVRILFRITLNLGVQLAFLLLLIQFWSCLLLKHVSPFIINPLSTKSTYPLENNIYENKRFIVRKQFRALIIFPLLLVSVYWQWNTVVELLGYWRPQSWIPQVKTVHNCQFSSYLQGINIFNMVHKINNSEWMKESPAVFSESFTLRINCKTYLEGD